MSSRKYISATVLRTLYDYFEFLMMLFNLTECSSHSYRPYESDSKILSRLAYGKAVIQEKSKVHEKRTIRLGVLFQILKQSPTYIKGPNVTFRRPQ